jgi:hypothetical protein
VPGRRNSEIWIKIFGDAQDAVKAFRATEKSAGVTESKLGKFAKTAKLALGAVAAAGIARIGADLIGMASDAEEAASAFETTFGPAVDGVQGFVDEFAQKAGFAEHELQQLLAVTGNIVQGLGGTEQASADLSEDMAILAGDVASFSNAAGGAPAVLGALQSALTGEREALKTYGIVISEADVQQQALIETGKTHASELTKLEKAQATLTLAQERAGKAMGDLDRTQDSAANTTRRLNAMWKDAQVQIGQALLPVLDKLLPAIENLIPKLADAGVAIAEVLVPAIDAMVPLLDLVVPLVRGFADAVELVTDPVGKLSEAGDRLTESIGDTVDAIMDERVALLEASDARDDATESIEEARLAQHDLQRVAADLIQEQIDLAEANRDVEDSADDTAAATEELEDAYDRSRRAAVDLWKAEQEVADRRRAALDPAFALIDAERDLEEAQRDLQRALEDSGRESDDYEAALRTLLEAQGDFNVALENLDAGPAIGAIQELARQAGLTDDDIGDLIARLKEFNRTPVATKTINYVISTTGQAPAGVTQTGNTYLDTGVLVPGLPRGSSDSGARVTVNVAGSVVSERDLSVALERELELKRRRNR